MLHTANAIRGYKLHGLDGEIGKVKEFYFDDNHWAVRYLVADTGDWLNDRQVLISPYALVSANKEQQYITIALTKKQIENSPSIISDKPVSRQFEEDYYGYYGWPMYWSGSYMWGGYPAIIREPEKRIKTNPGGKVWDSHLRSMHEVSGYHIQSINGEIGHVEDFIIDDDSWAIRYLIIDTRNWWPGKKVLVSPLWIERVSWDKSKVFINLSHKDIKQAPEYTEESLLTREYEVSLHGHYNRRGYWIEDSLTAEPLHGR